MSLNYITLSSSRKLVKESLIGGGTIVGKNVIISSITPIDGGNRITFSYTLDNGQKKESSLDVMNGENAVSPTITEIAENGDNTYRLEIKTKEKTFITPNLIPNIDLSKIVTDVNLNGNILIIKKANGSTKKITLPIISEGGNSNAELEEPMFVSSVELNSSKEVEIMYSGEKIESFPSFEMNYETGKLSVNNNGENNVNFNIIDKNMEVTY